MSFSASPAAAAAAAAAAATAAAGRGGRWGGGGGGRALLSEQLFTCAHAAPFENAQAEPPTEYIKKKAAAGCRTWLNVGAFITRIGFRVLVRVEVSRFSYSGLPDSLYFAQKIPIAKPSCHDLCVSWP